jgi:hypothetical protein
LKMKSSLIFRYHYTVNTPRSQVFINNKANKLLLSPDYISK